MRASCPTLLPAAAVLNPRRSEKGRKERGKRQEGTPSCDQVRDRFAQLQGRNDFSRVPSVRANSIFLAAVQALDEFYPPSFPFHPSLFLYFFYLFLPFFFFSFEIRKGKSSISISSSILISSKILFRSRYYARFIIDRFERCHSIREMTLELTVYYRYALDTSLPASKRR